ncbi:MAG: hypothetical protein D6815_07660 [Candidatus Dadabacteria bacterium]|nr:MAG: hypothetical protein D6815_07660 [Candidatus Dadabacteria bacterium]
MAACRLARRRPGRVTAAVAMAGWPLAIAAFYVNVVYLPPPNAGVTLACNLAMLLAALIAVWAASRVATVARAGSRPALAAAVAAVATAAGLLLAQGAAKPAPAALPATGGTGDRPDVYLIVIDTLRYDATSFGDPAGNRTPYLAKLARRGTLYERAYAQSSWTKPSVASLLTSLYPSTHGANLRRSRLPEAAETLSERLERFGYETAVFSANPWVSPAFGFDQGVGHFVEAERESFVRLVLGLRLCKFADRLLPGHTIARGLGRLEDFYGVRQTKRTNCRRDQALAAAFAKWMESPSSRPRFVYFHLMSPHIPYQPPGREHAFPEAEQVALLRSREPLPEQRRDLLVELYRQAVLHADTIVGRILAAIEKAGRLDGAVVLVTSDHGEEFYDHGHWGHGKSLYEELIHVPLVLAGPGVPAGKRVKAPVMLVDVVPTILELVAGIQAPSHWEGRSLLKPPPERPVYAELVREGGLAAFAIIEGTKKYLEARESAGSPVRRELFDLAGDPGEHRPLRRANEQLWHGKLAALQAAAAAKHLQQAAAAIDEEARKRLEALGYVN